LKVGGNLIIRDTPLAKLSDDVLIEMIIILIIQSLKKYKIFLKILKKSTIKFQILLIKKTIMHDTQVTRPRLKYLWKKQITSFKFQEFLYHHN
jgi:hypothetical protein